MEALGAEVRLQNTTVELPVKLRDAYAEEAGSVHQNDDNDRWSSNNAAVSYQ